MTKFTSTSQLIKSLRVLLWKQRLVLFVGGLLALATALVAASLLLSLLARVVILPAWLKIILLGLTGIGTVYVCFKYAIRHFWQGQIEQLAATLEAKNSDLKGRLVAAVQFAGSDDNYGYSRDLKELTLMQALEKASGINLSDAVTLGPVLKTGRNLVVAVVLAAAFLLIIPGLFSYSYEVYSNPTSVVAPPLGYTVTPAPGSIEWVKYRDIKIGAAIVGDGFPKTATVYHRLTGGSWQETEFDLRKIHRKALAMGDSLDISLTLRQINKSFDYYVRAGRVKTEIQKIDIVDRPRVNAIKLSLFYPDYTGLEPSVIDENNGSFSAVVGSRVNLQLGTNLPVERATLVFGDSSRVPLKVSGKSAEGSLVVDKSAAYYARLMDHLGEENPDPIEYYITAVPDEYPSIDVLRPGFDVNLNDEMVLPLKVQIFDDFGFSSLVLKYTIVARRQASDENVAVLHFSDRIKTEGEIEFNWDMDALNLFPADYVVYHFEVADNDMVSGPKVTKSRQFVARLPSLDEIIAQTESEGMERISKTDELLKTGRDLSERLKNISRKMKAQNQQTQKADWQHKKELESILDKNTEMLDSIEKSAQEMEKSLDKMSETSLMSREIMEKLAEVQKLFEEIATPEMKEAQKRLMEALKKMDRNELEQAIKDFQISQEELLKRLERTLALLKRMQLEQKMEAMLRQVEQLVKRQEDINQKTEASDKKNLPALSPTEDEVKNSLSALKDELGELEKLTRDAEMEDSQEARKFFEALKNTDAELNMQQMSQALNREQKESASEQGSQAHSKLVQLLDDMQQQLSAMKGGDMDAIKKAMRAALDDANYLSQNQEELLKKAGDITPSSIVLREMAAAQQDLSAACNGLKNRIAELGKQSPFVAAELQMLVENATRKMDLATTGFDQKRGFDATRNQRDAMVNLNDASIRLMESLEQQKQCDKGGSCSKPTAKLQSLCDKQNQLNQQTQNQCNNPGNANPKLSQGAREGLERLAGEQASIRKSLEDLNREFGNSRQILGRLDDIADKMKQIEEAMADGEVSQEMLDQQVKVYSRMLEATRSMYRKDFSQQRKAATATSNTVFLPPELSGDILNDRTKLEDRLRQYLGESFPSQYEKQIKAYFKALLQLESQPVSPER